MWRRLVESKAISQSRLVWAIAGLVALADLAFVLLPRRAAIASLARERDQLESQAVIERAALARSGEVADVPDYSDTSANAVLRALPESAGVADLLAEATRLTREIGLSIEEIQRHPDKLENGYTTLSLAVSLRGTYPQLTAFLSALEQMDRIVAVADSTIHKQQDEVLDAHLELRAYLLDGPLLPEEGGLAQDGGDR